MNNKITVTPVDNKDLIGFQVAVFGEMYQQVASLQDQMVRDQLISAGWTPPLGPKPQSGEYPELPELDRTAPERIWLQIDSDGRYDDRNRPFPSDANADVTWCADQVGGLEIEYIRADATVAMRAQAPTVNRETVIEWLDANDIEVTDKQMDGLFHATAPQPPAAPRAQKFQAGDLVRKTSGSEWEGRIVGTYSTALTPEGYAVESSAHAGSVQIYPAKALEHIKGATDDN